MNIAKFFSAAVVGALLLQSYNPAAAAGIYFVDPGLDGATQYDGWDPLTSAANPGYGGFPGSGAWPSPIGSNKAGSDDATLHKVANGPGGGPYPAGASIYFGGFSSVVNFNGGQLAVEDATPVADVANIVLQVEIGEAWTYDFWNGALPTLNYNGDSQALAATNSFLINQEYSSTVTMPTGPEDVYTNTWLLQWDVSGLGGVSSFSINFNGVQHAQLYALRLDQGDTFTNYVPVPEPATASLIGLGAVVSGFALRRRARV